MGTFTVYCKLVFILLFYIIIVRRQRSRNSILCSIIIIITSGFYWQSLLKFHAYLHARAQSAFRVQTRSQLGKNDD